MVVVFLGCGSNGSNENRETITKTANIKSTTADKTVALGSAEDPVDFYFTPSLNPDFIKEKGKVLIDFLEKETNLKYQIHVPEHYQDIVTAFGDKNADVAIMSSLNYIKAREAYGVTAALKSIRYNKSSYFGQIIANQKSGINSLEDLQGKSVVYTDSTSGSGFLYPKKMLAEKGIKPKREAFAYQHDRVVKMVYQGIADAGATFYSEPSSDGTIRDARAKLLDQYPDIAERVKVIAITEPIPNDPVVFSSSVTKDAKFSISKALIKFVNTDQGKAIMEELYSIQGYVKSSDSEYDGLRAAM